MISSDSTISKLKDMEKSKFKMTHQMKAASERRVLGLNNFHSFKQVYQANMLFYVAFHKILENNFQHTYQ